jgi:hypothetical protein
VKGASGGSFDLSRFTKKRWPVFGEDLFMVMTSAHNSR